MGQWEHQKCCPRCESSATTHIGYEKTVYFHIDKRLCEECGLIFNEIEKDETKIFLNARDEFYANCEDI